MKKLITMFLVLAMVLGLCACSGGKAGEAVLQVGFGRSDVLFSDPVCLSGGSDPNRISTNVFEYLQFTCVALTDGDGKTVLLYTQDLQQISLNFSGPALQQISEKVGVPQENILLASTHNHSAPSQALNNTGVKQFQNEYTTAMVKAAEAAMADRSEVTISIGSAKADGYVYVRHYELENGTYAGANYGDFNSSPIKRHVWEPDTEMQMVRFERADKKDILLLNLGCHATFNGTTSQTNLSADFPYPLRQYIEQNADVQVAYFMSAAGEQVPSTRIPAEDHNLDYNGFGQAVGKLVVDALGAMTPVNTGKINLIREDYTITVNKGDQSKLAQATEVYNLYKSNGSTAASALSKQYGFADKWEAIRIVEKKDLGLTDDVAIAAMTVGDVAFTLGAFEMFSATGKFIKENSPYSMTFLITQALDHNSYIPAEIAYEINCYEAFASKAVKGTAEGIAERYVDILKGIE